MKRSGRLLEGARRAQRARPRACVRAHRAEADRIGRDSFAWANSVQDFAAIHRATPFDTGACVWLTCTFLLCSIEDYAATVRAGIIEGGAINRKAFTAQGKLRWKLYRGDGGRSMSLLWHFEQLRHFIFGRGFATWWDAVMPDPPAAVAQAKVMSWTKATVPRQRFWRPGEIVQDVVAALVGPSDRQEPDDDGDRSW